MHSTQISQVHTKEQHIPCKKVQMTLSFMAAAARQSSKVQYQQRDINQFRAIKHSKCIQRYKPETFYQICRVGWINAADIECIEIIIAPLEKPNETSVTAVIGMILLPLLTERSLSQTVKSIDQEFSLKILRRDQNFNGQWLGQSHKGNAVIIKRDQGILTIEKVNKSLPKNITKLPGFNNNKSSLLSIATTLAPKPGKLIRELLNAKTQLRGSNPEINWISWLEYNFDMDDSLVHHIRSHPLTQRTQTARREGLLLSPHLLMC